MQENTPTKFKIISIIKGILTLIFWAIFFRTLFLMDDVQFFVDIYTTTSYSYKNENDINLYLKRKHKDESLYLDDISKYDVYHNSNDGANKYYMPDHKVYLIKNNGNSDVSMLLFKNEKDNTYYEQPVYEKNRFLNQMELKINNIFSLPDHENFNLSYYANNYYVYEFMQYANKQITLESKFDFDSFKSHIKIGHEENDTIKKSTITNKTNIYPNNLESSYLSKIKIIYNYNYIQNYIKYLVSEITKEGYLFDLYSFEFYYNQDDFNLKYDTITIKLSISNLTLDEILSDKFYDVLEQKLVVHDAEYIK